LEIYNPQMGPENNRTSFAVITSDPDIQLPKIKGNKDINVGIIEADNNSGGLLLSLLPLILSDKDIDMKAITSKFSGNSPMIGIISDGATFDSSKGTYQHIKGKKEDALKILRTKLGAILRTNYNIRVNHNEGNLYTLFSKNEPGALIKMLILLEDNNINLSSINSQVEGDNVSIIVETDDDISGLGTVNTPKEIKKMRDRLEVFIDENIDRIHEIITI
ncbi:MAG: hypothetical protein QM490_03655, partial [Candidatus Gracilibacteria bacterium]